MSGADSSSVDQMILKTVMASLVQIIAVLLLLYWCFTILSPILLGRGVETPMLVILIGAIGGAIAKGIIGLFIGAVILAFGYELLIAFMVRPVNSDSSR